MTKPVAGGFIPGCQGVSVCSGTRCTVPIAPHSREPRAPPEQLSVTTGALGTGKRRHRVGFAERASPGPRKDRLLAPCTTHLPISHCHQARRQHRGARAAQSPTDRARAAPAELFSIKCSVQKSFAASSPGTEPQLNSQPPEQQKLSSPPPPSIPGDGKPSQFK